MKRGEVSQGMERKFWMTGGALSMSLFVALATPTSARGADSGWFHCSCLRVECVRVQLIRTARTSLARSIHQTENEIRPVQPLCISVVALAPTSLCAFA